MNFPDRHNISDIILLDARKHISISQSLSASLVDYQYDQYRQYPAMVKDAWEILFQKRLENLLVDDEWFLILNQGSDFPCLIGGRISAWDRDHFGFPIGFLSIIMCGESENTEQVLADAIAYALDIFRGNDIEFISSRICRRNLPATRAIASHHFRHIENIIWPVVSCGDITWKRNPAVRLMVESDLEQVMKIASISSYQNSHFHCDGRIDKKKADLLLTKLISSALAKGAPLAVIDHDGTPAGFFAFCMDNTLSDALGYKYARMTNLAVDRNFRGLGLGTELFAGTMALMKEMGAEYIDSGLATHNKASDKLHRRFGFKSVYEEATFHLWLKP